MASSRFYDEAGLDDYLNEVRDIAQGHGHAANDIADEEPVSTPESEEGEKEAAWMRGVGLEEVAAAYERGQEIDAEFLEKMIKMAVSRTEVAVIKKRVDTLNDTTRRKKLRQQTKTDIRDIFSSATPSNNNNYKHHVIMEASPQQQVTPVIAFGQGRKTSVDSGSTPRLITLRKDLSLRRTKNTYVIEGGLSKNKSEVGEVKSLSIQMLPVDDKLSPPDLLLPTLSSGSTEFNSPASTATLEKLVNGSHDSHSISELPAYGWSYDPVGATRLDDLSPNDRKLVRQFALMELTTLFDQYNIDTGRPPKVKKKGKDHGIFSVPLQTLLEYDQKKHPHVQAPVFIQQLLAHMEKTAVREEGILRVPGSAYRIKALRDDLERDFNAGKWTWEGVRPNDAAGLLKQFLRELPVSLLTWDCMESFCKLQDIPDEKQRLACLNLLCLQLPDVNSCTLQLLLKYLAKVVEDSQNKMTLINVAMIVAPNLFVLPAANQPKLPDASEITQASNTASVMRLMIHYRHLLWTVPGDVMKRLRLRTEAESQKKLVALTKKPTEKQFIKQGSMDESITIKVHMQKATKKESVDVQVTVTTTAADVVSAVLKSAHASTTNGRMSGNGDVLTSLLPPMLASSGKLHLYECGGNIGERCLPSNALVLAVFKLNRCAEWHVKWKYAFDHL